jgi:hypothetical protein
LGQVNFRADSNLDQAQRMTACGRLQSIASDLNFSSLYASAIPVRFELRIVSCVTSLYEVFVPQFCCCGVALDVACATCPGGGQCLNKKSKWKSINLLLSLLMVAMILAIVGASGYYLWQNKQVLAAAEAGNVISASLHAQGPATIRFHTRFVKASVNEEPEGPHYRLLDKAGLLKVGKGSGRTFPIALTMQGQKLLSKIDDVQKIKEKDNTDLRGAARRGRLAQVSKVTMNSPERFLDASGSLVKSFNTWDRATLIDKYGANFYHAEPTKMALCSSKHRGMASRHRVGRELWHAQRRAGFHLPFVIFSREMKGKAKR